MSIELSVESGQLPQQIKQECVIKSRPRQIFQRGAVFLFVRGVNIDGVKAQSEPLRVGIFTSAALNTERMFARFDKDNLAAGNHTLGIVAINRGYFLIIYVDIQSRNPRSADKAV